MKGITSMRITTYQFFTALLLVATLSAPASAQPPRVKVEQKSQVLCVAWSPDGKWLATGTKDGTVYIIDAATGKPIRTFSAHDAVTALAISPTGKSLAVVTGDHDSLDIWDIEKGETRGIRIPGHRGAFIGGQFAFLAQLGEMHIA